MERYQSNSFTIAVLSGGASRRMGVNKSFASLAGKPLIAHTLERARGLNAPVLLVTNTPTEYAQFGVHMVGDVLPGKGSLGGIYSALVSCNTPFALCVACDMPFLDLRLMQYLLSLRDGFDAVVPVIDSQPQGLHAVYHRRCADTIRQLIDQDQLRITGLFDQIRVRLVGEAAIRAFDPDLRSFTNVNTPEELARARREVAGA